MPTKEEMAKFAGDIETLVFNTGYNYVEAVVEHCKDISMEVEVAATLINPNLKAKIESDANVRNLLKDKGARLPI